MCITTTIFDGFLSSRVNGTLLFGINWDAPWLQKNWRPIVVHAISSCNNFLVSGTSLSAPGFPYATPLLVNGTIILFVIEVAFYYRWIYNAVKPDKLLIDRALKEFSRNKFLYTVSISSSIRNICFITEAKHFKEIFNLMENVYNSLQSF